MNSICFQNDCTNNLENNLKDEYEEEYKGEEKKVCEMFERLQPICLRIKMELRIQVGCMNGYNSSPSSDKYDECLVSRPLAKKSKNKESWCSCHEKARKMDCL